MCSVGSTRTLPLLVVLLLLRIMMRGNHEPAVGSLGRHYQYRRIIDGWIDYRLMLYVGFRMVTTVHSESLRLFLYFWDISDGVRQMSYTDQRGLYNSLGMCRPFLHTLLLLLFVQKTLMMIDGFSFSNTLHLFVRYVQRLGSVHQTTWIGSTRYLIPS